MSLFMHAATLGRGNVPILPEDVRGLIWLYTFPKPVVWCSACGVEVIVRLNTGERLAVNTHPIMWIETPRCRSCACYYHEYA
jgi:hypothetical protein